MHLTNKTVCKTVNKINTCLNKAQNEKKNIYIYINTYIKNQEGKGKPLKWSTIIFHSYQFQNVCHFIGWALECIIKCMASICLFIYQT